MRTPGYKTDRYLKDEEDKAERKSVGDKPIEHDLRNIEEELLEQNPYDEKLEKLNERYEQTISYFDNIMTPEQCDNIKHLIKLRESKSKG
ncbi:MAG: hypothetical protein M3Z01_01640 [Thermoproteota archaeon]|nr:hypothetical protein [Thermoproteota archaeon]